MITFLRIRNLATIEDVRLDLASGFSVLTGETGAGKSIIIDGIRLVCGDKGSPDLVRAGAEEATIEAVFKAPEAEDGGIALQRHLSQGAGKAYLDGVLVPLKKLRDAAAGRVDVYGQNDHIFLLQLESHRDYLDRFARGGALVEETFRTARELRALLLQRENLRARERERGQRLDFLEFQIAEIEKAGLRPEEEEELRSLRHRLRNAEKVRALVDEAYELAYGGDLSLVAILGRLQTQMGELSAFDPVFAELNESLSPLGIASRELSDVLARYRDRRDDAPEKLEEIEERLSLIERFKRKYGAEIRDIGSYLDGLKAEREDLVRIQDRLQTAEEEIARASASYAAVAGRLSDLRTRTAAALEKLIEKEIGILGMKRARFVVQVRPEPFSADRPETARDAGLDSVEFLIGPNPGEPPKPLRKIASGGELSRIMLALKTVGTETAGSSTMVFDEIDSGVGGKTAEFVAQKLRSLAGRHQVLCITHLPQIASFAAHHYKIDKRVEKNRTFTTVQKLGLDERVEELARLMSGSLLSESALASARDMLRRNAGI